MAQIKFSCKSLLIKVENFLCSVLLSSLLFCHLISGRHFKMWGLKDIGLTFTNVMGTDTPVQEPSDKGHDGNNKNGMIIVLCIIVVFI